MNNAQAGQFNVETFGGLSIAQKPSYKMIKDSGSGSDSGIVNSEIVDVNFVASRNSEEKFSDLNGVLNWDEVELENTELLVFDDISRLMHQDHLFRMVIWEWKMLPATLYRHLCRLHPDRVREEIRQVRAKRGIGSRGGYLNRRLQNLKVEEAV